MKRAVLVFVLVSGCAAPDSGGERFRALQAAAKSVCELMADPLPYVGRRLTLKGIYFATPHERLLVDRDCPQSDLRVSHSLQIDGSPEAEAIVDRYRKKHPTVRIPVVYSGIFTAHAVIRGCTEPGCYRFSLEESQLLAAFPRIAVPLGT
ncbi:MAG TPA: hypothetical protein VFP12_18610 [Allosphingosinicella sp.]|nr:hypothetical protein [Allosphingosinicella sp.]